MGNLRATKRPATLEAASKPQVRMVGRPGLEPGTLGLKVPCSNPMS
jgi:hypothetical protein